MYVLSALPIAGMSLLSNLSLPWIRQYTDFIQRHDERQHKNKKEETKKKPVMKNLCIFNGDDRQGRLDHHGRYLGRNNGVLIHAVSVLTRHLKKSVIAFGCLRTLNADAGSFERGGGVDRIKKGTTH